MTFLERHQVVTTPRHWRGNMNGEYVYTSGIAGEKFFTALRDRGAFTASTCDHCKTTTMPPRIYCENCFAATKSVEVAAKCTVEYATTQRLHVTGSGLDEPQPFGLVRFEGTTGGLVHRLKEAYPRGTKVRPVLKEKAERTGEITDIVCFEEA